MTIEQMLHQMNAAALKNGAPAKPRPYKAAKKH